MVRSIHLGKHTEVQKCIDMICLTVLGVQVLVIVAASHLDAVTFQICSQAFKILPTAVFAALLLGQRLTGLQWASLPVLAAGITFTTFTGGGGSGSPGAAACIPPTLPCPIHNSKRKRCVGKHSFSIQLRFFLHVLVLSMKTNEQFEAASPAGRARVTLT